MKVLLIKNKATKQQIEEMLGALQHYIKVAVDVKQGVLADLARLANLLKSGSGDEDLFRSLITELKCFTEWTAHDLTLDRQEVILDLQRALLRWGSTKPIFADVKQVQREAVEWADKVLEISGLIDRTPDGGEAKNKQDRGR